MILVPSHLKAFTVIWGFSSAGSCRPTIRWAAVLAHMITTMMITEAEQTILIKADIVSKVIMFRMNRR